MGYWRRRAIAALAAPALGLLSVGATPAAPATAATCTSAGGVSVVVDFRALGGGVQNACVADGGGRAASTLTEVAGFALSYVQRQPGFVCRVAGMPADDPCVTTPPPSAYWGLYWSDGQRGWSYAQLGATSQRVPAGGSVGWAWQGEGGSGPPSVAAPTWQSTPTPSTTPKQGPSPTAKPKLAPSSAPTPTQSSTSGTTSPSEDASPTEESSTSSARPKAARREKRETTGSSTPEPSTTTPDPEEAPAEDRSPDDPAPGQPAGGAADADSDMDADRVPLVVSLGALLALALAGGLVALRRRSAGSG